MSDKKNIEDPTDKSSLPTEHENISEDNIQTSTLNIQHNIIIMETHHSHHPTD